MVTIYKTEKRRFEDEKYYLTGELRGMSTDTKPTIIDGNIIDNGTAFIEIDTGKIFFYDLNSKTWKEI